MQGTQLSCLEVGPGVAFEGLSCFHMTFVNFLSGSFPASLAYVSWGTTFMSFWQRTVVEKMPWRSHLGLFFQQTPEK